MGSCSRSIIVDNASGTKGNAVGDDAPAARFPNTPGAQRDLTRLPTDGQGAKS